MSQIYNKLPNEIQDVIDKHINISNKNYFKYFVSDILVQKAQKKHIIRYIIDYFIGRHTIERYQLLELELIGFIDDCLEDQYLIFLETVFKTSSIVDIKMKYNPDKLCNKILNNLSTNMLKQFKINYCEYYRHHGVIF